MRKRISLTLLLLAVLLAAEPAKFEVATIRASPARNASGKGGTNMGATPTTLTIHNLPLRTIIAAAYRVPEYQISGPEWLPKDRFDIVAKTGEPVANNDEMLPLLQPLLAERFHLAFHHESKTLPAYFLTVTKGGPKMTPASAGAAALPVKKATKTNGSRINAPRVTMPELAEMLSRRLSYPVRDTTGLTGAYRVALDWSEDDKAQNPAKNKPAKDKPGATDRPSIFTAVQQQLGLKLEAHKTPVELFVVDRVDRTPAAN